MAEAFFAGPVKAFMNEPDAPLLVAVQDPIARRSGEFQRLAPSARIVELPHLDDEHAHAAVRAIAEHRLRTQELAISFRRSRLR